MSGVEDHRRDGLLGEFLRVATLDLEDHIPGTDAGSGSGAAWDHLHDHGVRVPPALLVADLVEQSHVAADARSSDLLTIR